jgi:hypothetical protein
MAIHREGHRRTYILVHQTRFANAAVAQNNDLRLDLVSFAQLLPMEHEIIHTFRRTFFFDDMVANH